MIDLDKMHSDLMDDMELTTSAATYGVTPEQRVFELGRMQIIDQILGILENRNV